jgi:hypothetical protein
VTVKDVYQCTVRGGRPGDCEGCVPVHSERSRLGDEVLSDTSYTEYYCDICF